MEVQLMLAAFIVSSGFSPILPEDRTREKTITSNLDGDSTIQENFRHFFDSITKNDPKKAENYRLLLEEGAAKGQEAFETMKEQLQSARPRNAHRRRNFHNEDSYIALSKRETSDQNRSPQSGTDELLLETGRSGNSSPLSRNETAERHRRMDCARACKKVSKLMPNLTRYEDEFYYNVSVADKRELIDLSYHLFTLDFQAREVKDALQTVFNETSCKCPRIRSMLKKIDLQMNEGLDAIAVRFEDIKHIPPVEDDDDDEEEH